MIISPCEMIILPKTEENIKFLNFEKTDVIGVNNYEIDGNIRIFPINPNDGYAFNNCEVDNYDVVNISIRDKLQKLYK